MAIPVALQLYTVRDEAARDFAGTLDAVAAMGYTAVELAGYGGMEVVALRAKLGSLGLAVAGSHVAWPRLEGELSRVMEECHMLRCQHVVCPALPSTLRTAKGYQAVAEQFAAIGQTCAANELTFCYHNHAWEFETEIDGTNAYDWLLTHTDRARVQFELDAFWVVKAGRNPADYLSRFAGRFPLVHLKDISDDARETFAPVGAGKLDFAPIFGTAESTGTAWYIVEQDKADGPALDAARLSLDNLRAMGKA